MTVRNGREGGLGILKGGSMGGREDVTRPFPRRLLSRFGGLGSLWRDKDPQAPALNGARNQTARTLQQA